MLVKRFLNSFRSFLSFKIYIARKWQSLQRSISDLLTKMCPKISPFLLHFCFALVQLIRSSSACLFGFVAFVMVPSLRRQFECKNWCWIHSQSSRRDDTCHVLELRILRDGKQNFRTMTIWADDCGHLIFSFANKNFKPTICLIFRSIH